MKRLEDNIKYFAELEGVSLSDWLTKHGIQQVGELTVEQLFSIAETYNQPLDSIILHALSVDKEKLKNIKFLILDIDGVMTDAGMYFMESGDQMKKYNAKDGMAIMELTKNNFPVGIISSGFKLEMVKSRAELLRIPHVYVGREPKMDILTKWCSELNIELNEVAIIGDDINDLPVMRAVGFSCCPSDAVPAVKNHVDLVLNKAGGKGCVREFIDHYLLASPVHR